MFFSAGTVRTGQVQMDLDDEEESMVKQERPPSVPSAWAQRPQVPSGMTREQHQDMLNALDYATRGADAASLGFAIGQAHLAGVTGEALARAVKRKAVLDGAEEAVRAKYARRDAELGLQPSAGTGNSDMLAAALAQASDAGVAHDFLIQAGGRAGAVAREARAQRARPQALAAIRAARKCMDIMSLLVALREALTAGLDADVIKSEALGGHDPAMAACILKFAMRDSDDDILAMVLEWGRQEKVPEDMLVYARRRLQDLQTAARIESSLADAASKLAAAWRSGNPEVLGSAIDLARLAGVSEEMLNMARRRQKSLLRRAKREAEAEEEAAARHTPVDSIEIEDDPEKLAREAALHTAAQKQVMCKEAATSLKAALRRGKPDELQNAIEEALAAGVSRELIAPARRKLSKLLVKDEEE